MPADLRVGKKTSIPFCTVCLVMSALTCHALVLVGNLRIAATIGAMGDSVHGWSGVGFQLATSLTSDIDHVMEDVTDGLTNATRMILTIQRTVDNVLSSTGSIADGTASSSVLLEFDRQCKEEAEDEMSSANMLQTVVAVMKGGDLQPVDVDAFAKLASDAETMAVRLDGELKAQRAKYWRQHVVSLPGLEAAIGGEALHKAMHHQITDLSTLIHQFMDILRPVLQQIGRWIVTFGERLQGVLESFSTTIDKVQKIFDDLTQMLGGRGDFEQMVYDTYTIMDADNSGNISVVDLINASGFYNIESLQPRNAARMVQRHDTDGDNELNEEEYRTFVNDDAVPGIMSVALREYAKLLSSIAGTVESARLRDEVASAVVDYFSLVCAKNATKVSWVSDRLTNGSLPLAFTADILKQLAQNDGNPNIRTTADVGFVIISEMMRLNEPYVLSAFQLMSDPNFWQAEGFNMDDQAGAVSRVSAWIHQVQATNPGVGVSLIEHIQHFLKSHSPSSLLEVEREGQTVSERVRATMASKVQAFRNQQLVAAAVRRKELLSTRTSRLLFKSLIGQPQSASTDPAVTQMINNGVPAVPETLEFARFLANNASSNADIFQRAAAAYTGSSSNPLQSFSNDIKGMINRIVSFLDAMERYATPDGIRNIERNIENFLNSAADEMTGVIVQQYGNASLMKDTRIADDFLHHPAFGGAFGNFAAHMSLSEMHSGAEAREQQFPDVVAGVQGAWSSLNGLLSTLTSMMPTVVDNIVFARTQVGAVSKTITSIFDTVDSATSPIFPMVSRYYRMAWIAYFVVFALLTLGVLAYGFWAAGFFGGPGKVEEYVPPQTFWGRCCACIDCCGGCLRSCHDGYITCWSFIIAAEIFTLLLFLLAILLSIIAGVQYFITSGCSMVYLLGDTTICGGILGKVTEFMSSFLINGQTGPAACSAESLTACGLMASQMKAAVLMIVIGSFVASIVTLEMIIDSAVNHEQAIWRKRILDETEEDEDADLVDTEPKKGN
mmetsp:Transcript_33018/g.77172  ORF Transcript_33018/g.77172 Transcript_33018/m.77172 type:complete len:1009 (-) Transcript_33018:98-3124(-)|eukprot:CAMPEP_0178431210 /NCGR_PEP_ID=MMETSP0689_2-20121128/31724_1 /TAXON_ID=160604 /ORGANISM="Amphidinium massartii, Strain CS-259" /LENGTH=1008 /DNA_ID=CAMNT_0020053103 /DNA_START=87 /DNA_END=3113 /DNA_ORIENTATION=+